MPEPHRYHGERHDGSHGKSAHRKSSMATIENGRAANPALPARRRQRLSRTTSMLVTVTFVVIFTCIIAMEMLYIDESKRLKSPDDKIPEMHDENGVGHQPEVVHRATLASVGPSQYVNHINRPAVTSAGDVETSSKRNDVILDGGGGGGGDDAIRGLVWTLVKVAARRTILAGNGYEDRNSTGTASVSVSLPAVEGDWQPVLGTRDKFFVYSAYLDDRQGAFIRVLAATRTRGSDRVHCAYWYTNKDGGHHQRQEPIVVQANNKVIRENWNLKYSATFVLCPLFLYNIGRRVPVPDYVSIVVGKAWNGSEEQVGNRLPVLNRNADGGADREANIVDGFAVCVKPLHYHFNRAMQLIEFIELNRILGVTHFTFYNHTIGPEVDCVLRDYARRGIVTLLPWQHLEMVSQKEIRTEGLFAAINDCLYRNMYRYRYVLMIDIDEFIVPHRNATLTDVMRESLRRIDTSKAGSFSFMNSFYYLQWPDDSNARELPVSLVTLQKTQRRAKFHPHKQRSKCIVVPRHVVEMGNHFVWEFLPGKGAVNFPPDVAYLHHYRVCEFGGDDCVRTQSVTDRTIYRYKNDLVRSVVHQLNLSRNTGPEDCQRRNYESHLRR